MRNTQFKGQVGIPASAKLNFAGQKADGALIHPSVQLQVHYSAARLKDMANFLCDVGRDQLLIQFNAKDIGKWQGYGTLGKPSLEPPKAGDDAGTFVLPLTVHSEDTEPLRALLFFLCDLSDAGEHQVQAALKIHQMKLDDTPTTQEAA